MGFEEEKVTQLLNWGTIKAELVYWLDALERFEWEKNAFQPDKQEGVYESIYLLRRVLGLEDVIPGYGQGVIETRVNTLKRCFIEASNDHALSIRQQTNGQIKGMVRKHDGSLRHERVSKFPAPDLGLTKEE